VKAGLPRQSTQCEGGREEKKTFELRLGRRKQNIL